MASCEEQELSGQGVESCLVLLVATSSSDCARVQPVQFHSFIYFYLTRWCGLQRVLHTQRPGGLHVRLTPLSPVFLLLDFS